MKDMTTRLLKLFIGNTIASFAITCVLKANFGCFATTAMNMAIHNWFGISIGMAGFIVEAIILLILLRLKEGLGLTALVNMTYGSLMIDVFNTILPTTPWMILGLPLIAIGWALMGEAGFGDTNNNLLMNALLKRMKKGIGIVRALEECTFLAIGFIGSNNVTWFTLALSLFLGYMLEFIYKLIKYNPIEVEHQFLIGGKEKIVENN